MSEKVRADEGVVVGGVDTHRDTHVAAVVDGAGRLLGADQFPTDTAGYRRMVAWVESWGPIGRIGVEGTGSYGAGLARHLTDAGYRRGGSEPSQPPAAPPAGQDRFHRRRSRRPGCLEW